MESKGFFQFEISIYVFTEHAIKLFPIHKLLFYESTKTVGLRTESPG